jgi:pheromone shutdown protein TraB
MNNRVRRILGYPTQMSKHAADGGVLQAILSTGKGAVLTTLAAFALAGVGTGYVAEKISAPVETDFDNARDSYAVGNLKAMLASNANKLSDERMRITNKKQKAMHFG